MTSKIYALVGSWDFKLREKGLHIYRYNPKTADLEWLNSSFPNVSVGHQYLDSERGIVYITDERRNKRDETGGGGFVLAIHIDETGKPELLSEKESLAANPSFIWVDKTRRYAVVTHHCGWGNVIKIVHHDDGSFGSETLFDDAALVLFSLKDDGSFGNIQDIIITPGFGSMGAHIMSHQHSVMSDPTDTLWLVCDKGTDRIYSYHLDREKGKLLPLAETVVETCSAPRYGTFHPTHPLFYGNNENNPVVFTYQYDVESGKLDRIGETSLLVEKKAPAFSEDIKIQPSDIIIRSDGRFMYAAVRGLNLIAVLAVDNEGILHLKQNIDCGGKNPRGLAISHDGRYLFAANMESDNIISFAIADDGTIAPTGKETKAPCPGSMTFLTRVCP
jgi:6-phosphogluconolactonase (cycloisomerase 2 family)